MDIHNHFSNRILLCFLWKDLAMFEGIYNEIKEDEGRVARRKSEQIGNENENGGFGNRNIFFILFIFILIMLLLLLLLLLLFCI